MGDIPFLTKFVLIRGIDWHQFLYKYIYGWLNRLVTDHNNRVTVALALQGGQGTGKGLFVPRLAELFCGAQRYLAGVDTGQVVGYVVYAG